VLLCRCLALYHVASGQIYQFEKEPVPPNRSLHTLYAFYVYSETEAPDRLPGGDGRPFVGFSGLEARATSPEYEQSVASYAGVQLSIMRYKDFFNLINPKRFCSDEGTLLVNLLGGEDIDKQDVFRHTIYFNESARSLKKQWVRQTGVYILVFSNCGDFDKATVTGTVTVKNAYGYLPGNEFHKLPFYGWLLLVYMGLALIWMVLSIRWWKELFNVQNCIAIVIFFGLLESFLWYIFFNDWNQTGVRPKWIFIFAILFTVVKSTFSYMLVLVASLGWGVTRPFLDHQVILKLQVLCLLYIVLDFIRESVLSFRHSYSLSLTFVLLCLLPVSLLNGAIFYWVFTALSSLMETLRERRQTEKLVLFQRLWKILIAALTLATCTLLFQIFNISRSITSRWKYQWLLTDGITHALFLFVLAAMMYLWAPHKYSQRFAYSHQLDGTDENTAGQGSGIWADEFGLEEDQDDRDDGESFWATTRRDAEDAEGFAERAVKARADVIGIAGGAEERDAKV